MKLPKPFKQQPPPDLLPLMDCMFILLIYFIFSMMMMIVNVNIPMSLPKQELEDLSQALYMIEIKNDGSILWNKDTISISYEQLELNIESLIDGGHIPAVFVTTQKDVEYGMFISILDLLRELNITKITLDTGLQEHSDVPVPLEGFSPND